MYQVHAHVLSLTRARPLDPPCKPYLTCVLVQVTCTGSLQYCTVPRRVALLASTVNVNGCKMSEAMFTSDAPRWLRIDAGGLIVLLGERFWFVDDFPCDLHLVAAATIPLGASHGLDKHLFANGDPWRTRSLAVRSFAARLGREVGEDETDSPSPNIPSPYAPSPLRVGQAPQ